MYERITIFLFFFSSFASGQSMLSVNSIDSLVSVIDRGAGVTKKVYETSSYEREDGGPQWDSLYIHREYYYKDGQIVKIIGWNKYGQWRLDQHAWYDQGRPIKYSNGESFYGQDDYGAINFDFYYSHDKEVAVVWGTPKPANVLGIATDVFLQSAYALLRGAK